MPWRGGGGGGIGIGRSLMQLSGYYRSIKEICKFFMRHINVCLYVKFNKGY